MDILDFVKEVGEIEHVYQVTSKVYSDFQQCSGDLNPLHTQFDFAKSKGFNECVMYGNILNAFVSHFVGMLLPTPDVMIQSQDIQFHKPFFLNDQITLTAKMDSYSESVNIVVFKFTFKKKSEGKSQMVAKGHVQIGLI